MMFVVINYLNLLPLPVLDGGRILQRLAFTRWPLSDAVFSVIGALAMNGGGLVVEHASAGRAWPGAADRYQEPLPAWRS